jgi:hypothetical protein
MSNDQHLHATRLLTLSTLLATTLLVPGMRPALGQNPTPTQPQYPLMHFTPEEIVWMQTLHRNAPQLSAPPVNGSYGGPIFGTSVSLLARLPYVPVERQQGQCGDCWQWASTGVLEIAHNVQNNVSDRLSVQFINSCNTAKNCCQGGWIDEFAAFYTAKGYAIPWTNTGAAFSSGGGNCTAAPCGSIGTAPQYPIGNIQAVTIPTAGVGQAQAIANIKNALNQNKALAFGFFLPDSASWNDFFNFWNNQPESALWSNWHCGSTWVLGEGSGHAVLCVGYNDDDPGNRYWIMVNSWGAPAGRPNGIFHVAMDLNYDCALQSTTGPIQSLEFATLDVQFTAVVPRLDHFGWDTITSPQGVNAPFPVTVSALTAAGAVETNFNGAVSLAGFAGGGASATLWSDGFEDRDISDWNEEAVWPDYYYISVTTNTAAAGTASLYMYGGYWTPCDGLSHTLSNITPSRINFYVASSATNNAVAYFVAGNNYYGSNSVAFFLMSRDGTMGLYDGTQWHGIPYLAYEWYKISLVLDWTTRTIDYYVNDSLRDSNIPFRNPAVNSLTLLNIYNYDLAYTWYDQIEFVGIGSSPVPVNPATSGSFTNGIWHGSMTIAQPVTNLVLQADDGFGHTGLSNPFNVASTTAPAITVTPSNLDFGSILVGSISNKTLCVTNSGAGTLIGSASVSAPFSIVSGGTYSLGPNQGQAVMVGYAPTAVGTNTTSVNFTGGGGASAGVAGAAYMIPTPSSYSFTNLGTITINDASPSGVPAAADPYPSTITVGGLSGAVTNVTATLRGYTHSYPHDVGVLLVGPKNQKVVLMANSCGWGVAGLRLTFDDDVATCLTEYPDSPIVSGTYRPSNCGSGDTTFPSGAPVGPYANALSVCNGSTPNGVWSLYVQDDSYYDSGSIANGWVLSFNLVTAPAPPVVTRQPQDQRIVAGWPAAFSVTASNAQTYTWRMNGTNLVDGGRISGSTNPVLVISNTTPSDSGSLISCVVSNSAGSATSSNALLKVYPAVTPWFSAFTRLTNSQVQWILSGAPMSNYTVHFSSDLKTWKTLATVTTTNGSAIVLDPTTGQKQRYYRAVLVQ